ncbi:charged multivesicular body protein 6 isoform X1 [Mus caroli]|uniref:Charged multivesicular body protein 6 isoform X1 n=2 Tax=Mus TaxID=862507 RepID=A0A6P7RXC2_MUSCR|nr:charged multivesicular body protein 6 isoform X1 [Mus caroli]
MGNLFGRKKQSRVTEQDRAILQLKQQRDKLRQYQKRVTQQLERERALARQLLRDGRKERAKLLLKKKRYREQLLDRTENQISSLEAMVQSIEFTQIEMKVMEGLQVGNECLNKMHQVMSIEEVERILDETQEAVEYQRQIDELLAGNFTQEDEDAILEELNAITQVQSPGLSCPLGDGTLRASAWWCVPLLCLSPESWFPDPLPTVGDSVCTEAKQLPHSVRR